MKKVGILTINDYSNYGNRLQNYASQEVIKSLGYEVETIVNKNALNRSSDTGSKIERLKSMNNIERFNLIKDKIFYYINRNKVQKYTIKKINSFKEFTKNNIKESKYMISDDNIPNELNDKFDFFVTGSDQVWNPVYRKGSPIDFLTFAEKNKRVAYSPSFGISYIPEEYKANYKTWINEMKSLSVREEAGAKIIKELTGRDAEVLLDPTMMLNKKEWLLISKKSEYKPNKDYLLTYFLGKKTKEYKTKIQDIAKVKSLEIVNLGDISDVDRYCSCPGEFIDYINEASVVITDSFHGAVFSILLEKPFIVFDRVENGVSMSSRIDTLLNKFELSSRKLSKIDNINNVYDIDYKHIGNILKGEKEKVYKYLRESLN